MARNRPPEIDYLCLRCGCACDPPGPGAKHVGGGPGMRACKHPPHVMLRRDYEADVAATMAGYRKNRLDR